MFCKTLHNTSNNTASGAHGNYETNSTVVQNNKWVPWTSRGISLSSHYLNLNCNLITCRIFTCTWIILTHILTTILWLLLSTAFIYLYSCRCVLSCWLINEHDDDDDDMK